MAGREEIDGIENQASQEDDTSLASSFASASGATSPIKELDQQDEEKSTASTAATVEQKVEKISEKEIGESIINTECAILVDECATQEVDNKIEMSANDLKNRLNTASEKNSIEDSGTESSEDLRVLAADLREKIQMHSSKNTGQGQKDKDIISEVAEALTKLETSLKDGEDIHLNRGKRNALLTLVANLQNHLLCSEDGPLNSPLLETSSPEYDARNNRHRFARKRNRVNRHTVGVSKEEIADARKYIEDLVFLESLSNAATPDVSTDTTPTSVKRNSIGNPLGDFDNEDEIKPLVLQLSKSSPKLCSETPKVHLRENSQNHLGSKVRPLSDSFPDKKVTSAYQRALERSRIQRSPEPIRTRFINKKQLMKRANTIDIPKAKQLLDSESDGEDNSVGLLRVTQVNVKQKPKNKVPDFVPKTENDHKFLAFLQKNSHTNGFGWNQNKSVTNWTNKFGNIKSAFERGSLAEKTALKPPLHPHQPTRFLSKSPCLFSEKKQIFSPPSQNIYQSNHSVNPYHQHFSQQELQSNNHSQPATIPKPVPINQFIHASKSVFKPVKPQISQFQPIRGDDNYNQPKWNIMSSTSSPSGFSTHSEKWKGPSNNSSPVVGLPWTVKPANTNSVLKIASTKFANPEPEEYKPKSNLYRGYSLKQLNTTYQPNQDPSNPYNGRMLQKRPSLPETHRPFTQNSYSSPPNSLTNPQHQPLVLTNNNPIYCPENPGKSPKSFGDPTPYPYLSNLPPHSPLSFQYNTRNGPVSYSPEVASSIEKSYGNQKNTFSVDPVYRNQPNYVSNALDDGMEYKTEIKVMKSPISHQAVKIGSRLNQNNDMFPESVIPSKSQPAMNPLCYANNVKERHCHPLIDNVQKQRERFDQPEDFPSTHNSPMQFEQKIKPFPVQKQRQVFDRFDNYEDYSGQGAYQNHYFPYNSQDRPLPVDRDVPFDRPLPYDRKLHDTDTQMKEEELRLLKERQAEIERQLFLKAEQERIEALEREEFVKKQEERKREIEEELMKAKEECNRQMALRIQEEQFLRQKEAEKLRAQQEEIERQKMLRAQREEIERKNMLRAQQEEIERQRALRSHEEEMRLRAQREEIEKENLLRAQEYENERQKRLRAQEIERQEALRAQEIKRQEKLREEAEEAEREKILRAEDERQKKLRAESEKQKALKLEMERQKAIEAHQLLEKQKAKQKQSKLTEAEQKSLRLQEERNELEKKRFLKAEKEHEAFYQKERQRREEELQMIRVHQQNSIEEYNKKFTESESNMNQKRHFHIFNNHEFSEQKEKVIASKDTEVLNERRETKGKPEVLPKPARVGLRKPMVRAKTESAIDIEKMDWQQNPIYNGNDSKPNVIYNNVSMKSRAFVLQDSKDEDEEIVKSSLENNMVLKKYGPPQRHCYLPNSYQSPVTSSKMKLSQSRQNVTKTVSNATSNHVTKITAQFAAQQNTERHSPEPQLRRSKSGHTLALPKMFEGKINKTELVQKQRTVEAYFTGTKSPNPNELSQSQATGAKSETSKKSTSSQRFKNKSLPNSSLSRSHTMPQLNDLNLLDESNIEDAFDQLISTAKL